MKMVDTNEVQHSIAKIRAQLSQLSSQRETMTYQLVELTNNVKVVQRAVHIKWMDVVMKQAQSNAAAAMASRSAGGSRPVTPIHRTSSTLSAFSQYSQNSVDGGAGSDSSGDDMSPSSSPRPEAHPSFLSRVKPKRPSSAGMSIPLRVKHVRSGSVGSEKLLRMVAPGPLAASPTYSPTASQVVLAKSESIQSLQDPRLSDSPALKKTFTVQDLGEVRRSSVTGQIEPVSALSRSTAWRSSCSQLHNKFKSMSSIPRSPSLVRKLDSVSTAV